MANYAQLRDLLAPFKAFLSPQHPFVWTPALDAVFEMSKRAIIEAICNGVEIFDITERTCLRTDWSVNGIGYYLSQKHCSCQSLLPECCSNGWKVTLAGSRFIHGAEQCYATIEGEALAIAWSLEQTKYFTQGCDNLLITPLWNIRCSLYVAQDDVVMYGDRVVIPTSLRKRVLGILHSAHQGVSGMEAMAQLLLYWPGIATGIQKTRDECLICCKNAPSQPPLPLTLPDIPSTPFESVFADYFDVSDYRYLVAGDRLVG